MLLKSPELEEKNNNITEEKNILRITGNKRDLLRFSQTQMSIWNEGNKTLGTAVN